MKNIALHVLTAGLLMASATIPLSHAQRYVTEPQQPSQQSTLDTRPLPGARKAAQEAGTAVTLETAVVVGALVVVGIAAAAAGKGGDSGGFAATDGTTGTTGTR